MNPGYSSAPYSAETVALQGRRHEVSPGQSGGLTGVQHTIVNVPTEPTRDYLVWSLWNFVYGNFCCLGLAALICSVKARDRKMVGDQLGARGHASTARVLNIAATVLTSLTFILCIVVPIVVTAQGEKYPRYNK
ncbi:dispanin subfamily A member 2b-like [Poecilia formosa]|uniref:dispanin subfamily A member 2b-like n=1 Tax=Poecilia formosa TaxID=48698 RepID=UPI0007B7C91B|nr:PREDICTED: dispanin subfamily A member 2b-like [Poecilia formosa]